MHGGEAAVNPGPWSVLSSLLSHLPCMLHVGLFDHHHLLLAIAIHSLTITSRSPCITSLQLVYGGSSEAGALSDVWIFNVAQVMRLRHEV